MSTAGKILNSLPLEDLFGAPFKAATKAQIALSESSGDFIRNFALDSSGNMWMQTMTSYFDIPTSQVSDISGGYLIDASGGGVFTHLNVGQTVTGTDGKLRKTSSKLRDPQDKPPKDSAGGQYGFQKKIGSRVYSLDTNGKVIMVQGTRTLTIPFISLINVPSLFINEVSVDFAISIKTQSTKTMDSSLSMSPSVSTNITGNAYQRTKTVTTASSSSAASSKSDNSTECTYLVNMRAKQVEPPGLAAMLLFLTSNKDIASKKRLGGDGKAVDDHSTKVF